jgi:lipid-binding SYLF domain-containing protein
VLSEIMAAPDKSIPRDLLQKAQCTVIVPDLKKGAFIVGAKYGKGVLSCRTASGRWSAPGTVRVEGGSVGFQIGGEVTDVVLLVMNPRGADKLLGDQFTLGGGGEVAAGPIGRAASADTDAKMSAEILSWSRNHGVFAGVSLQGATLRQDLKDNEELYGKPLTNREIVSGNVKPPAAAEKLLSQLNQYSVKP